MKRLERIVFPASVILVIAAIGYAVGYRCLIWPHSGHLIVSASQREFVYVFRATPTNRMLATLYAPIIRHCRGRVVWY